MIARLKSHILVIFLLKKMLFFKQSSNNCGLQKKTINQVDSNNNFEFIKFIQHFFLPNTAYLLIPLTKNRCGKYNNLNIVYIET